MKKIATLSVPPDWVILNEQEKKTFIQENFADDNIDILEVATPKKGDGSVFALLSTQLVGYVEDKSPLDARIIQNNIVSEINILNSENDAEANDKVHWKKFAIRPNYDPNSHCATYGIELAFGKDLAINLYQLCLIRNGALILTLVGEPKDRLTLKGWEIKPLEKWQYDKFNPNQDDRFEGNLNNLLSMNRII